MSRQNETGPEFRLDLGYPEIRFYSHGEPSPLACISLTSGTIHEDLTGLADFIASTGGSVTVVLPASEVWRGQVQPDDTASPHSARNATILRAAEALTLPVSEIAIAWDDDGTALTAIPLKVLVETDTFLGQYCIHAAGMTCPGCSGGFGLPDLEPTPAPSPAPRIAAPYRRLGYTSAAALAACGTMLLLWPASEPERKDLTLDAAAPPPARIALEPGDLAPQVFSEFRQPRLQVAATFGNLGASTSTVATPDPEEAGKPATLQLVSMSARNAPQIPLDLANSPLRLSASSLEIEPLAVDAVSAAGPRHRPVFAAAPVEPEPEPEPEIAAEPEQTKAVAEPSKTVVAKAPPRRPARPAPSAEISNAVTDAVADAQSEVISAQVAAAAAVATPPLRASRPERRQIRVASLTPNVPAAQLAAPKKQPVAAKQPAPQPKAVTRAAPARATKKPATTTRAATERSGLNNRKLSLVGLFGSAQHRRAIVMMPNGQMRKVRAGDRIGNQQVAAVGQDSLRLSGRGRDLVLKMPN